MAHHRSFDVHLAQSLSDPNASTSSLPIQSYSGSSNSSNHSAPLSSPSSSSISVSPSDAPRGINPIGEHAHQTKIRSKRSQDRKSDGLEGLGIAGTTSRNRDEDWTSRDRNLTSMQSFKKIFSVFSATSSSSSSKALFSWIVFLILIMRLPNSNAIFDPGEPNNHQPSDQESISNSISSSTSTSHPYQNPAATSTSASSPIASSISTSSSSGSNTTPVESQIKNDKSSYHAHLETYPDHHQLQYPNQLDLIPFSNSYVSDSDSSSLYSSSRQSLPPGCKRIKDLFLNSENNGFCLNPFGEIFSNNDRREEEFGSQGMGMIESELVICEIDEVEPLLKDLKSDQIENQDKKKKRKKMRSYAISGKISSPFPLEIETDGKDLERFLDYQGLVGGTSSSIVGIESGSITTTNPSTQSDQALKSNDEKEGTEEDEENWPKEGIETQNGYWRQVNGKMKWQPSEPEPEPLIRSNEDENPSNKNNKSQVEANQNSDQIRSNEEQKPSQDNQSQPTSTSNASQPGGPFKTKISESKPTQTPQHVDSDRSASISSQSKAYSSWTSIQSSVASAAAKASSSTATPQEDEDSKKEKDSDPTPSFLSFSEWKEIHLKQEREELGKMREIRERERRDTGKKFNNVEEMIGGNGKPNPSSDNSVPNRQEIPSISSQNNDSSKSYDSSSIDQKKEIENLSKSKIDSIEIQTSTKPDQGPKSSSSTISTEEEALISSSEEILSTPASPSTSKSTEMRTPSSNSEKDSNILNNALPALGNPLKELSNLKHRWNFASFDCAAVVHRANPSAKFASAILSEKKDRYMLSPCPGMKSNSKDDELSNSNSNNDNKGGEGQFVIVELCDEISIDTIVLGNYEFFSRMFKRFRVRVARKLQGREDEWFDVGTFRARNVRGLQVFNTIPPRADSRFFRYVRIDFLEHYGSEYYCPVSLLRVYGLTQMDDYIREEEEMKKQKMLEMEGLGEWTEERESIIGLPDDSIANYDEVYLKDPVEEEKKSSDMDNRNEVEKETSGNEANNSDSKGESIDSSPPNCSEETQEKKPPASEVSAQPEGQPQPSETSNEGHLSSSNSLDSSNAESPPATPPAHRNISTDKDSSISLPENVSEESTLTADQNDKASSRHLALSTPPPAVKDSAPVPTPTSTSNSGSSSTSTSNEPVPLEMKPPQKEMFEAVPANFTLEKGSGSGSGSNLNHTDSIGIHVSQSSAPSDSSAMASNQSSTSIPSPQSSSTTSVSSSSSSSSIPEQSRTPNPPPSSSPPISNTGSNGGGGGSESIYRTISKRLTALESNATLSLQYMEHSGQALRDVFARMEKRQEEKMGEMLRALNGSNWRQIEALKRRQHVDLQRAIFEFDVHRQQVDAERVSLLAQVHVLADEVMLERRLSIAQLVLLLGLFVFMALTRGSRAPPLMARIASRGRSASHSNSRIIEKSSISSPQNVIFPSTSSRPSSHSNPGILLEEVSDMPKSTRGREEKVKKGRIHSHTRSTSGLASENRPVRLPRSLKPPSFSRSKGSRSSNLPSKNSRLNTSEEPLNLVRASAPPVSSSSSSKSSSFSKSDREALKQSLRVNVLNNHANINSSPSYSASPSNDQPIEDFAEMSPKALRAHLGFLSPRSNSPSSIHSSHNPNETRTSLQTLPTPRSSSPISLSNIKARFSNYGKNGSRSSLLNKNNESSRPSSPINNINGLVANDNGEAAQFEPRGLEEVQDPNISGNFRSDDSVSSWTDRSENSEDGDSDEQSSFSNHHSSNGFEVGDKGETASNETSSNSNSSNVLAPALTFNSPKPKEESLKGNEENQASEDFSSLLPQSPTTPISSNPTTHQSPTENSSEWQEVLPRRSSTFRRQGSSSSRLTTPDKDRNTPPPFNKISVRSSSSSNTITASSSSQSISSLSSSSPSTPNCQSRFPTRTSPDSFVQRPHSPAHHSPLSAHFSNSRFKPRS